MNIPDSKILVYYDAMVKEQGRGGRIHPNPFPDHIGKKAIVIILDEDSVEEPARIAIQLQNRARNLTVSE
uniref:Transposon-encoded protein n=1 Tax=Methanococcus maripaludis (strain C6 / ATCC BAA-1332) TaxID=444158 RepID=A9A7I2_METM6